MGLTSSDCVWVPGRTVTGHYAIMTGGWAEGEGEGEGEGAGAGEGEGEGEGEGRARERTRVRAGARESVMT